jgi:hypothetical protein
MARAPQLAYSSLAASSSPLHPAATHHNALSAVFHGYGLLGSARRGKSRADRWVGPPRESAYLL